MASITIIIISVFWMLYKILNSMGAGIDTQSTYDLIHQKKLEKAQYEEYLKKQAEDQKQRTKKIIDDLASKRIKAKHKKTPITF